MNFKYIVFSLFLLTGFQNILFAQLPAKSSISGLIVEKKTKEPLEFVNVSLFHSGDSTFFAGVTSSKDGKFSISNVPLGNYYLQLKSLGYEQAIIPDIAVKASTPIILGTKALHVSAILLKDVSVVKKQTALLSSIDRKTYNVEKDIMGQTGSASDILQNIPSVSVDIEGNVSLRGSSNVTFFINGRPSALLKRNSAVALQQIPANTIERIEVITNPSAKYKPDGIGGILNIILKKEKQKGTNGTFMANVGNDSRFNTNLTLNYNTGKMNIFGSYGFRRNYSSHTSESYRINRDSMLNIVNILESTSNSQARPYSHLGNFGIDYQMNKNNKLELAGDINVQDMHRTQSSLSTWKDEDLNIIRQYTTSTTNDEPEMEWEASAVYIHQFNEEGHELQFEFNISDYDETEDNRYKESYTVPSGNVDLTKMLIKKGGPTTNVYAEYTLPIGDETELEAGYVGEFFTDNISYLGHYYDANSNEWIKDVTKSNDFIFRQDIHALYGTLAHSFEKFSFMAGLRAEQALITSHLMTLDSLVPNNYFRVYPTLHLAYDINDEQQFQLNYSHRVRRPDSDEMNPFPEYSDPRNMEAGNPHLKPEQIHSIEFGYQLKKELFTIQPSLYYRYTYDAFTQIYTIVNDSVLLRTEANLSKNQSLGGEFIATLNAGKLMTLNWSTNAYYNVINASNLGYSANKSAFAWNSKIGANINITNSTMLQLYGYFRSKRLTAQGSYDASYYTNMGLRQNLFKNKASLVFTVSDVFNTLKSSGLIDTPILYQKWTRKRISQIVYLGFTYRFGKSEKNKTEDLKYDNSI